jgi:hypothetical protein
VQVQYAVQLQGAPGGSAALTEVLDAVASDATAVGPVLRQLLRRIDAALGSSDNRGRPLAVNFGQLLKLSQLLLSVAHLGSVRGANLAAVQPTLTATVQRALRVAVHAQSSSGGDDAPKLARTLLALLRRLAHVAQADGAVAPGAALASVHRGSSSGGSVAQEAAAAAAAVAVAGSQASVAAASVAATAVAVETLEVGEMDFSAHSTLSRLSSGQSVRVVRNHAATGRFSRSRSPNGNGGGDERRRVSKAPMTGHATARLSVAPVRTSAASLSALRDGTEAFAAQPLAFAPDALGTVFGQFAVSSIVNLALTGEARQVVEALLHVTSPRTWSQPGLLVPLAIPSPLPWLRFFCAHGVFRRCTEQERERERD